MNVALILLKSKHNRLMLKTLNNNKIYQKVDWLNRLFCLNSNKSFVIQFQVFNSQNGTKILVKILQ